MRTAIVLAAFMGLMLAETVVRADVPGPGPRPLPPILKIKPPAPQIAIPLVIEGKTTSAIGIRLVLPAKLIKELQNSVASTTGSRNPALGAGSTVMVGLSLSLAVVCGGLCLVKSRRRLAYGLTVCLVGSFIVIGVGCPPFQRADTTKDAPTVYPVEITNDGNLQGKATVEVSSDAENVQVQIDNDKMRPWIEQVGLKTEFAK